jgi:hypothetical protein
LRLHNLMTTSASLNTQQGWKPLPTAKKTDTYI